MNEQQQGAVATFTGGINRDVTPPQMPEGDYLFALNALANSREGDRGALSNENSIAKVASIPEGYLSVGSVYMTQGETAIFLVEKGGTGVSEIGIYKDTGQYTTIVNDKDSPQYNKLNFAIDSPISAVFRMRRGCERTIYWVERNGNVPRYFIFDKASYFQDKSEKWDAHKFALQKSYSKIPTLTNVQVLDTGGHLLPGTYNIGIQLLDRDFNKTEWITTTGIINIYHDSLEAPFSTIKGSVNGSADPIKFGATSKAISVDIGNIDEVYPYYRLCLISSNSTNGTITKIEVTKEIDIKVRQYIFNGSNVIETITEAELMQENNNYANAKTIAQIENRLLLGNMERENINWGRLQKYASRINADCIIKAAQLDNVKDSTNYKNPSVRIGNTGYMPGEIYSFGIVYLFENGLKSPVFHIPGKSSEVKENVVYKPYNGKAFGMKHNNEVEGSFYTTAVNSKVFDFWGLDGNGKKLENRPVRHHRFPTRADIWANVINIQRGDDIEIKQYRLKLNVKGTINTASSPFNVKVSYTIDNQQYSIERTIIPAKYSVEEQTTAPFNKDYYGIYSDSDNIDNIKIFIGNESGVYDEGTPVPLDSIFSSNANGAFSGDAQFDVTRDMRTETFHDRKLWTNILGIQFSNIDLPSIEDTNGHKPIGYYIVRNERTDDEKTILDTGVITPTVFDGKYASTGLMFYQPVSDDNATSNIGRYSPLKDKYPGIVGNHTGEYLYGLIHPEFIFNGKQYNNVDEIEQIGYFQPANGYGNDAKRDYRGVRYSYLNYDNVTDGSSLPKDKKQRDAYDKGNDDAGGESTDPFNKGYDGQSFSLTIRDVQTEFWAASNFTIKGKDIKRWFFLDALENQKLGEGDIQLYNLSTNNRWIAFDTHTKTSLFHKYVRKLPYVALKKTNKTPYQNYNVLPYYKDVDMPQQFIQDEDNVCAVFGGDVWVTPYRFASMLFFQTHTAKRVKDKRKEILKWVGGAFAILAGIGLMFVPGGQALAPFLIGAGLSVAGIGALLISSGIKQHNIRQAFDEDYKKGLNRTIIDNYFGQMMSYSYGQIEYFDYAPDDRTMVKDWGEDGPSDDTIMWGADCVTDLWFESSVNIGLRNAFFNHNEPTFLDAPGDTREGANQPLGTTHVKNTRTEQTWYRNSNEERHARNKLERYLIDTILYNDAKRSDGKGYLSVPLGVYNNINLDYYRQNDGKPMFCLPKTYDLLSKCQNKFPHRIVWSNQSFQEQFSDNYTQFLPNNYIDIDGSTGVIRELVVFNNNIYVFTEECLWRLPNERQERVQNDIVTYIGTGEFLSIPATKIIDSHTGMSAGCIHKYSVVKTPQGLFYVSVRDNKIYHFNGNNLTAITDNGIMFWSKENIIVQQDLQYYLQNKKEYPYIDNPNNPIGSGYIAAYDTQNNRVLFTKKDLTTDMSDAGGDYLITSDGNTNYIFYGYNGIIALQEQLGWQYIGVVEGKRMKFRREVKRPVKKVITIKKRRKIKKTRQVWESIFKNIDYLEIYYYFNYTDLDTWTQITSPIDSGGHGYRSSEGSERIVHKYYSYSGDNRGAGAETFVVNIKNIKRDYPNATKIDFRCRAFWHQDHGAGNDKAQLKLITFSGGQMNNYVTEKSRGADITDWVFETTGGNPANEILLDPIVVTRDFKLGEGQISWEAITNFGNFSYDLREGKLYKDGVELANNKTQVLKTQEYEEIELYDDTETITTDKLVTEFKYIDAIPYNKPITDYSWTLSYSLLVNRWISYHSYFPNMYITTPNSLYSIGRKGGGIYEHNKPHSYQQYYGRTAPHIVEAVIKANALNVSVWDTIRMVTDAQRYINGGYYDARLITFTRAILYNSRQCSGMLQLRVKDATIQNYIPHVSGGSPLNISTIDRREKDWHINEFRDIRIDYDSPIFFENIGSRQGEYYIDKVLNEVSLDVNKDWKELERFRDRYLIIRLTFDGYSDVKLLTRFLVTHNS